MELGHWKTDLEIPNEFFGFIYRIKNTVTGKTYIGRKQAVFSITKPPLKGKKRKRRGFIESDYKTYTGSNSKLNEDIKNLGKEYFRFEIIRFCQNKTDLAYFETVQIIKEGALLLPNYYNEYLYIRIRCRK